MDMSDLSLSAIELRARIFASKTRLQELKDKRKRYYKEISKAKQLIRTVESCIDRGEISDISLLETDSIRSYLSYLKETLNDLECLWKVEVEYSRKLHEKIDDMNERVYL